MFLLFFFNLFGLMPYSFRFTTNFSLNFSLAFTLWVAIILGSIFNNVDIFLVHFQPEGSPRFLNPFLCLIELVSRLVRPITLRVRISANLSIGHIVFIMIGNSFVGSGFFLGLFLFLLGMFYFLFEIAVCIIQGYIFRLLPILYIDE